MPFQRPGGADDSVRHVVFVVDPFHVVEDQAVLREGMGELGGQWCGVGGCPASGQWMGERVGG